MYSCSSCTHTGLSSRCPGLSVRRAELAGALSWLTVWLRAELLSWLALLAGALSMSGAPGSSGQSSASEGREPPDFSVRSMLAALRPQQLAAGRPRCDATLSVYPGFELLTAMVVNQTDAICPIGVENRQFLSEVFLLQSFLSHPCRVPHPRARPPLGATSARPHFYVIPVLWRALSLLCQAQSVRRRHPPPAVGCPLARTAAALVTSLVSSTLFRFDAEHHISPWLQPQPQPQPYRTSQPQALPQA